MQRIYLFIFLSFSLAQALAQTKAIEFQTDNDVYTFKATRDEYYTNGFYIRFKFLSQKKHPKLHKKAHSFSLNHRIFTSDTITRTDLSKLDRPYAGQLSASYSQEFYFKKKAYLKSTFELGWMGPSIKTKEFQHFYHGLIGLYKPRGWNSEISDTPIINLYVGFIKSLLRKEKIELLSESSIAFGTVFNNLKQGIILRAGRQNPLHTTSFIGGNLDVKDSKRKLQEFYFLLSPQIEYVYHNSTIDGNFIGKPSILTLPSVNWVFINRIGIAFAWQKFDLNITHYYKSIETPKGRDHQFVAILFRFKF